MGKLSGGVKTGTGTDVGQYAVDPVENDPTAAKAVADALPELMGQGWTAGTPGGDDNNWDHATTATEYLSGSWAATPDAMTAWATANDATYLWWVQGQALSAALADWYALSPEPQAAVWTVKDGAQACANTGSWQDPTDAAGINNSNVVDQATCLAQCNTHNSKFTTAMNLDEGGSEACGSGNTCGETAPYTETPADDTTRGYC